MILKSLKWVVSTSSTTIRVLKAVYVSVMTYLKFKYEEYNPSSLDNILDKYALLLWGLKKVFTFIID